MFFHKGGKPYIGKGLRKKEAVKNKMLVKNKSRDMRGTCGDCEEWRRPNNLREGLVIKTVTRGGKGCRRRFHSKVKCENSS